MDSGGNLMTKARDLANAADVLDDVSATELSYVNGVTSAIQTQLNAKAVYPNQSGNDGKYLTTNGSTTSWGAITTDPTPTVFMLGGM
jgi:Flp pilus assembly protein TadG